MASCFGEFRCHVVARIAVDCGPLLEFSVTKIVTSLLSGAVLDGSYESLKGLFLY